MFNTKLAPNKLALVCLYMCKINSSNTACEHGTYARITCQQ